MKNESYGAPVERGNIAEIKTEDGIRLYRVASISRAGIVSGWIPAVGTAERNVGEPAFFVLYDDGDGLIL